MAASLLLPPSAHRHCITTPTRGAGTQCHPAAPRRRPRPRGALLVARGAAVPPEQSLTPHYETLGDAKAALYQALEGVDRGIFGITSAKRSDIHALVELLESRNPTPDPTHKLQDKVDGCWRLIYSTISILGKRRTKLGLRDFISLGDFFQIIDVKEEKAVNVIKFSARALKIFSGQLAIEASYTITTKTRVGIKLETSTITPDQLMNIFQKNYDMLLAIFNPEGWLEITYVDESLRIGRDDKANIFVLEKTDPSQRDPISLGDPDLSLPMTYGGQSSPRPKYQNRRNLLRLRLLIPHLLRPVPRRGAVGIEVDDVAPHGGG